MKVSVSLPEDDVEFLDAYARSNGIASRSAVLHRALGLLKASDLSASYEDAWAAWVSDGDADAWDSVTADGIAG